MPSVMWFRRDLRLLDNPALVAAVAAAQATSDARVVPLFVVDPALWERSGPTRLAYLIESLRSLDSALGGNLLLAHGDPTRKVPEVVTAAGATSVHVAEDFGPYGRQRDQNVTHALGAVPLVMTGSAYAVAPGRVAKPDGTPYRVFTPYHRAWTAHGWRAPASDIPADVDWWMPRDCDGYPSAPDLDGMVLPPAGEAAAWQRWEHFRSTRLSAYSEARNRPDLDGTSAISHHLRFGELHPRSLLAELSEADEVFCKELCWREFYADVLFQRPDSARQSLDPRFDATMRWNSGPAADDGLAAWRSGRTGYPFVDAGMRQLRVEGWVHNRVRMVVASFLVKDLHLPWQLGAREFMHWLRDGDLASNVHGWQWTAGCGTDAAPFYRVFNPVLQGLKFDPDGDYVRRYVPELAHLPGPAAHEPWKQPDGLAHGYPERIVDHSVEREAALADFARIKADAT
ncbi:MAG: deoxyribodipyrimidine photo-lyase [Actinomycetes bacterium]